MPRLPIFSLYHKGLKVLQSSSPTNLRAQPQSNPWLWHIIHQLPCDHSGACKHLQAHVWQSTMWTLCATPFNLASFFLQIYVVEISAATLHMVSWSESMVSWRNAVKVLFNLFGLGAHEIWSCKLWPYCCLCHVHALSSALLTMWCQAPELAFGYHSYYTEWQHSYQPHPLEYLLSAAHLQWCQPFSLL